MTTKTKKTKNLFPRAFLMAGHKRKPPKFYPGSRVVDPRPPKGIDCGCKRAGIGIFNDNYEIQRCDDCNLFETDDDAAAAVHHLLRLLGEEYRNGGGTVADAADRIADRTKALLAAKDALEEGYVNCGEENVYEEPLRMVKAALGRRGLP
jgi:hypothetical protein